MCILAKLRWCMSGCRIVVFYQDDVVFDGPALDVPDEFNQLVVTRLDPVSAGVAHVFIAD